MVNCLLYRFYYNFFFKVVIWLSKYQSCLCGQKNKRVESALEKPRHSDSPLVTVLQVRQLKTRRPWGEACRTQRWREGGGGCLSLSLVSCAVVTCSPLPDGSGSREGQPQCLCLSQRLLWKLQPNQSFATLFYRRYFCCSFFSW